MSDDSSFKIIRQEDNEVLSFINVEEHKKRVGYIPIGSAITSYARNFTIRAAQMNYNGCERGFIYADTDSIHCDLNPSEVKGIKMRVPNNQVNIDSIKHKNTLSDPFLKSLSQQANA